ncbi:MAG TPA: hypothetical protein VFB32_14485 [Rudaea sp.]|nr:hypothetical protein [Rudaea sp.]
MRRLWARLLISGLVMLVGCDIRQYQIWHGVTLSSGAVVKITAFNFAWGVEHDERHPRDDCFALEFVTNVANGDEAARERELADVFELIRPAAETWGLTTATVARFPTLERKGHYDFFAYARAPDGTWAHKREDRKVFSTD